MLVTSLFLLVCQLEEVASRERIPDVLLFDALEVVNPPEVFFEALKTCRSSGGLRASTPLFRTRLLLI